MTQLRRTVLVVALLLLGCAWGLSYARWRVGSVRGRVLLAWLRGARPGDVQQDMPTAVLWDAWWAPVDRRAWRGLGVEAHRGRMGVSVTGVRPEHYTYDTLLLALPYWLLATPLLAPCAAAAIAWRRRAAREKSGRCVACGYDLRESGDRCPECGGTRGGTGTAGAPLRRPLVRGSLLLLACVAVAWALSYATYRVDSLDGRLMVSVIHGGDPVDVDLGQSVTTMWDTWLSDARWSARKWGLELHRAGAAQQDHYSRRQYSVTLVAVPYWQLAALIGAPPLGVLLLRTASKRRHGNVR